MPTYDPRRLGPEPRDPSQKYWDPAIQVMPREQRRELQLERLRALDGRSSQGRRRCSVTSCAQPASRSPNDIQSVEDLNCVPTHRQAGVARQRSASIHRSAHTASRRGRTAFASARRPGRPVRRHSRCGLVMTSGSSTSPRRRAWWRNGWRPGQIVTHAHPAYLYGGGVMLSGSLEYFGMLNLWVAPPDTDELAEQGIHMWERVHPDVSMVAFNYGRFAEVASKLGKDLTADVGLPSFVLRGFGKKGLPHHDVWCRGVRVRRRPVRRGRRRARARGLGDRAGGRSVHGTRCRRRRVGQPRGDHPRPGQRDWCATTSKRRRASSRDPCRVRRDDEARASGAVGSRTCCRAKASTSRSASSRARCGRSPPSPPRRSSGRSSSRPTTPHRCGYGSRWEPTAGTSPAIAGDCAGAIAAEVGVEAAVEVVERGSLERQGYKQVRLVDR